MVVVWGDMAKSQVDGETVEEAIDRLIQAHDDDANAHLDASQSLNSHKASEIIDHLARSVFRDKFAFDRFQIDEHFSSVDGWSLSAGSFLDNVGQLSLTTSGGNGDMQNAYAQPGDSMENGGAAAASPVWEVRVKLGSSTTQTAYIIQGDPALPAGFGFKIVNGTLYWVYWDGDSVEQTGSIAGVTVSDWHNFRCEYIAGTSVKWYVDGVLKRTQTTDLPTGFSMFAYFEITANTAAVRKLYVQSLHYDEDYTS